MSYGLPSRVLTVAAAAALLAGCSSSSQPEPGPSGASAPSPSAGAGPAGPAPGISPGGVTTSVNAAASVDQAEHYQACRAATLWMSQQPGDPDSQIEPYLAMLQASPTGEDGTWNTPWSQLPPGRQAEVILAANEAAEGRCQ